MHAEVVGVGDRPKVILRPEPIRREIDSTKESIHEDIIEKERLGKFRLRLLENGLPIPREIEWHLEWLNRIIRIQREMVTALEAGDWGYW